MYRRIIFILGKVFKGEFVEFLVNLIFKDLGYLGSWYWGMDVGYFWIRGGYLVKFCLKGRNKFIWLVKG